MLTILSSLIDIRVYVLSNNVFVLCSFSIYLNWIKFRHGVIVIVNMTYFIVIVIIIVIDNLKVNVIVIVIDGQVIVIVIVIDGQVLVLVIEIMDPVMRQSNVGLIVFIWSMTFFSLHQCFYEV